MNAYEYLRSAIKKYPKGQRISTNELVASVKLLEPVESTTLYMGARYRIFREDISKTIESFRYMLTHRLVDEKKQELIWQKIQRRDNGKAFIVG